MLPFPTTTKATSDLPGMWGIALKARRDRFAGALRGSRRRDGEAAKQRESSFRRGLYRR